MNVTLRPEIQKFIQAQVQEGHFASESEALEAGVARLMLDPPPDELDELDGADLRKSLDQMRRGQVVDWREHTQCHRTWCDTRSTTQPRS